jgi:tRNA(Arg) A34 adenosine deaminase TadA
MKKVEMLSQLCRRACRVAQKSGMNHRHGAVIVRNGEVVAEGFNYEAQDFSSGFSVHAEMDALAKVKHLGKAYLSQCDMVVVRIGPSTLSHTTKMSMPCPTCRPMIEWMGIRKVYYTTNEEFDIAMMETYKNAEKMLRDRNAALRRSNRYTPEAYRQQVPPPTRQQGRRSPSPSD